MAGLTATSADAGLCDWWRGYPTQTAAVAPAPQFTASPVIMPGTTTMSPAMMQNGCSTCVANTAPSLPAGSMQMAPQTFAAQPLASGNACDPCNACGNACDPCAPVCNPCPQVVMTPVEEPRWGLFNCFGLFGRRRAYSPVVTQPYQQPYWNYRQPWFGRRRAALPNIAYAPYSPMNVRTTVASPVVSASACDTGCNAITAFSPQTVAPQMVSVPQTVPTMVPQTRYRTRFAPVPVTNYRPVSTVDACTGQTITTLQPCISYRYRLRRVPVTTFRPAYQTVMSPMVVGNACQVCPNTCCPTTCPTSSVTTTTVGGGCASGSCGGTTTRVLPPASSTTVSPSTQGSVPAAETRPSLRPGTSTSGTTTRSPQKDNGTSNGSARTINGSPHGSPHDSLEHGPEINPIPETRGTSNPRNYAPQLLGPSSRTAQVTPAVRWAATPINWTVQTTAHREAAGSTIDTGSDMVPVHLPTKPSDSPGQLTPVHAKWDDSGWSAVKP